jgi:hypothetical protein
MSTHLCTRFDDAGYQSLYVDFCLDTVAALTIEPFRLFVCGENERTENF